MHRINSAIIGFGDFTNNIIIPFMNKTGGYRIKAGLVHSPERIDYVTQKFSLEYATTDYQKILNDNDIHAVFIATRHHQHKEQIIAAIKAGKAVFTEKPMSMTRSDAEQISQVVNNEKGKLMIGFNRRFSPLIVKLKQALHKIESPYIINYRWINKAWTDTWPFDPVYGGGKLISSGCHMIDLVLYIMGKMPQSINASIGKLHHKNIKTHDTVSIMMNFNDGSIVNILSGEMGAQGYPQEKLEVFTNFGVIVLDDFKTLKFYDIAEENMSFRGQEKGFIEEFLAFHGYLQDGCVSPCGVEDGLNVAICINACLDTSQMNRKFFI